VMYLCIESDARPPPVIYQGPQNQTLPTDGTAALPCLASGQPAPNIIWLKGRSPLNVRDRRLSVRQSGTLEITGTCIYRSLFTRCLQCFLPSVL